MVTATQWLMTEPIDLASSRLERSIGSSAIPALCHAHSGNPQPSPSSTRRRSLSTCSPEAVEAGANVIQSFRFTEVAVPAPAEERVGLSVQWRSWRALCAVVAGYCCGSAHHTEPL